MPWLADFFRIHMGPVFFVYGLALFSMGLALALESGRGRTGLCLEHSLPSLAIFAFLVSAAEWIEMFLLYRDPSWIGWVEIRTVRVLLLAAGAFFLARFGARLVSKTCRTHSWLRWLPIAFLVVWLLSFVVPHLYHPPRGQMDIGASLCLRCHTSSSVTDLLTSAEWLVRADVWARYLLYLPGALLAGWGLASQARFFKHNDLPQIASSAWFCAIAFGLSAIVAGLVVPPGPYFPTSVVNYDTFLAITGVPPQIVRALLAVAIAYFSIRVLRVFEIERRWQLQVLTEERFQAQQALLETESRHRRELEVLNAQLARSNELKSRFLAIASHDMKSPLVATQSYLQVILGGFAGELQPKQREMLERSSSRINDLLELIGDLLDTAKIESGQFVTERRPLELAEVVMNSVENVRPQAVAKSIELEVSVAEGTYPVLGSKQRLQQVVTNLLSNAVKYTPDGGRVKLVLEEREEAIWVEVTDTGIGIPGEALPHIFDEFYRVQRSDGRWSLGLGLYIAKKIVDAHGGEIWAESPVDATGQGSRFTVKLPKSAAEPSGDDAYEGWSEVQVYSDSQ